MTLVKKTDFLKRIGKHGIGMDAQGGSDQQSVIFINEQKTYRKSWITPPYNNGSAIPFFLSKILEALDPWQKCWVWKSNGDWGFHLTETSLIHHRVWANILHKSGIPEGFKGAIAYNRDEFFDLLTVLYIQTAFGWCVANDLFIVPDQAKQIVKMDHHGFVHVTFINKSRSEKFVLQLSKDNIKLPSADELRAMWVELVPGVKGV